MAIDKISFDGNPNIGLYATITKEHVLLGKEISTKYDERIEKTLGLPIKRITMAGTSMIGVFSTWAEDKLLIPEILFPHEIKELEETGIKYEIIKSDLTCLGNNIIIGPKKAIINPEFTEEEAKKIQETINKPITRKKIMDLEAVGSIGVIRKNHGLFHRDLLPEEIDELEKELGIKIMTGSINLGNPYIKSGIIVGEKGMIIGGASGGPEIINADEALGFKE